jgi:hypothetical protein
MAKYKLFLLAVPLNLLWQHPQRTPKTQVGFQRKTQLVHPYMPPPMSRDALATGLN